MKVCWANCSRRITLTWTHCWRRGHWGQRGQEEGCDWQCWVLKEPWCFWGTLHATGNRLLTPPTTARPGSEFFWGFFSCWMVRELLFSSGFLPGWGKNSLMSLGFFFQRKKGSIKFEMYTHPTPTPPPFSPIPSVCMYFQTNMRNTPASTLLRVGFYSCKYQKSTCCMLIVIRC